MMPALERARDRLPLRIESVDWQDPVLVLSGNGWSLACNCAWRVSSEREMLFGCWDDAAGRRVLDLIGLEIVDVRVPSGIAPVDPVFVLSDSTRLELFSTHSGEPWVFRPPIGEVLVASPTDPDAMS